ncbi:hypothetical protein M3Y98_00633600 [Aphelenchoides besseyi]|nr:hypothetical protein M3Y98_00633600 [Aphelenchoides besseyi]
MAICGLSLPKKRIEPIFRVQVILTEDGKIIEEQFNVEGDKSVCSKITRFVEDGNLIAICQANQVEARRVFARVET